MSVTIISVGNGGYNLAIDLIKANIFPGANEYLVPVREVAEPVKEIERLLLATTHREVAGMYHNISLGQILKPMMAAVCIR